jgi:hypothetical protein
MTLVFKDLMFWCGTKEIEGVREGDGMSGEKKRVGGGKV